MLIKTQGIVISFIKFRETSIICKIYTETLGLQSYIVNGVRKHGKKSNMALYQPLSILDLVVYHKPNQSLHRIGELKSAYPFQSVFILPVKIAIGLFITEMVSKTIKEGESHEEIYTFLKHSILELDCMKEGFENFHLGFLIQFAQYLGFTITSSTDILLVRNNYGKYQTNEPAIAILDLLIQNGYSENVHIKNTDRRMALELLINFYKYHFETMGDINSIKVLQEMNQ